MSGTFERVKRNMAALTPQFKIKCSLEQGEFVRVTYANFPYLRPRFILLKCKKQDGLDTTLSHYTHTHTFLFMSEPTIILNWYLYNLLQSHLQKSLNMTYLGLFFFTPPPKKCNGTRQKTL